MFSNTFVSILLVLPALLSAEFLINSFRDYKCQKSGAIVECHLSFEGNEEWEAVNDNGCFKEFSTVRGEVIEWCPLQCPDAENAFVVEKPSVNGCSTSESFGIEQRKNDWFFWRTSPCDQEETTFKLACRLSLNQKRRHPKLLNLQSSAVKNDIDAEEEMMTSSEEAENDKTLLKQVETDKQLKVDAEEDVEDPLVNDVDTLLRIMFPSYRNN